MLSVRKMAVIRLQLTVIILISNEVKSQDCMEGIIRLMGSSSPLEGRVEIFLDGYWGTVCDDFWSLDDAAVVCRQLGFSTEEARSFGAAHFGEGSGPIVLDNVQCMGNETRLADCRRSEQENINCNHGNDAGVRCRSGTPPSLAVEVVIKDLPVLVRWSGSPVPDKYNITVTETISTSVATHIHSIISNLPSNQSEAEYVDLRPEGNYTVCAIGIYCSQQTVSSCTNIQTLPQPSATPSTISSSLLKGILGSIIAVLVLLLIVAGIGLAYPRCIRHRVHDKEHLKNSSKLLDGALHLTSNEVYVEGSQHLTPSGGSGEENHENPVYETITGRQSVGDYIHLQY